MDVDPGGGEERPADEAQAGPTDVDADAGTCPECGGPSTAAALSTWGNCRACRTAQSRLTNPLRW